MFRQIAPISRQPEIVAVMSETGFYYQDQDRDFWKPSLDIETGIKTIENLALISRLVLRLLKIQSCYQYWYQDF